MDNTQNAKKKLRVGILIRNVENLSNWEYRILKGIIEHPHLELTLFIKDGRERTNPLKNRLKKICLHR